MPHFCNREGRKLTPSNVDVLCHGLSYIIYTTRLQQGRVKLHLLMFMSLCHRPEAIYLCHSFEKGQDRSLLMSMYLRHSFCHGP